MVKAAAAPELQPMTARPSGSCVSFTLVVLLDLRQHFGLDELGELAGERVVFEPALAALRIAAAVLDHDGDHGGHALLGDQVVEDVRQRQCPARPSFGPSCITMNGALACRACIAPGCRP